MFLTACFFMWPCDHAPDHALARRLIACVRQGESITVDKIAKLARSHVDVSILFMDIVGFTAMSKDVPAEEVIGASCAAVSVVCGMCALARDCAPPVLWCM